jgi:hypothetical protein
MSASSAFISGTDDYTNDYPLSTLSITFAQGRISKECRQLRLIHATPFLTRRPLLGSAIVAVISTLTL